MHLMRDGLHHAHDGGDLGRVAGRCQAEGAGTWSDAGAAPRRHPSEGTGRRRGCAGSARSANVSRRHRSSAGARPHVEPSTPRGARQGSRPLPAPLTCCCSTSTSCSPPIASTTPFTVRSDRGSTGSSQATRTSACRSSSGHRFCDSPRTPGCSLFPHRARTPSPSSLRSWHSPTTSSSVRDPATSRSSTGHATRLTPRGTSCPTRCSPRSLRSTDATSRASTGTSRGSRPCATSVRR